MKKKVRKLTLTRETLLSLGSVSGGVTLGTCGGCATWGMVCGKPTDGTYDYTCTANTLENCSGQNCETAGACPEYTTVC